MTSASEPLLPVEPDRPSRLKLRILLGAAGLILIVVAVSLVLRRDGPPPPTSATADADRPLRKDPRLPADRPLAGNATGGSAEECQAKDLFDKAEAFERSEPGEYEKRIARWREVVATYPTSSWARKADERHRAAAASLQALLDREFETIRKDALALSAAGHPLDAIEALRTYQASQTRDLLKRRADLEIAVIENAARTAFNETAAKARQMSDKGDHAAAEALLESLAPDSIAEVATRCRTAIAQLRAAAAARAQYFEARRGDDARRAVREEIAPRLLDHLRARRYEEALKELSAAAALPAHAAVKEEIAVERASVADASSFWEAFLRTLKARTGQETVLLLDDGRRLAGRVSRIQSDRVVLEHADGAVEAPLDRLHADLLVGWTLGRSLPADDAVSYVKAALFFFCEGRDDLAKLYLATARELKGPVDPAEKCFREGFLRAAMSVRK